MKPSKNHETNLKNHGNQPKTMKNHETTLKNYGNQPKTMKNHEITLKNQGGRAGITEKRYLRGVTTDLIYV